MSKEAKYIQIKELEDSKKGSLYFLSKLQLETAPSFSIGLAGKFLVNTEPLSDLKSGCEFLLGKTSISNTPFFEKTHAIVETIEGHIQKFFDAILDKAKSLFGEALVGVEWLSEFAVWGIQNITGSLANLIPLWGYVRAAADMYSAIKTSVLSTIKLIEQSWSGYGVNLLTGTPSVIANALVQHNAMGVLGGLKDLALKSLEVGLEAAGDVAGGVGSLISLITDILERIFQLVMLCVQKYRVKSIISEAKDAYTATTSLSDFYKWFRFNSVTMPIIPSLVLQSGYVANPIRFLSLFDSTNEVIGQKEYDKGVKHIETLKALSKDYINDYKSSYKLIFNSSDAVSNKLLSDCYKGQ